MRERKVFSSTPVWSWNQRKSFLPAVQAKGRPSTGSLSPGACPTRITRLGTAPPLTTGFCIFAQRRQRRSADTWRSSRAWGSASLTGSSCGLGRGDEGEKRFQIVGRGGIGGSGAVTRIGYNGTDALDSRLVVGESFRHAFRVGERAFPGRAG